MNSPKELTFNEIVDLPIGTHLIVFTYRGTANRGELVTFLKKRGSNIPDRVQIRNLEKKRSYTYNLEHQMRGLILFYRVDSK